MFRGRLNARGKPGRDVRQPGVCTAFTPGEDAESTAARNKLPRLLLLSSSQTHTHTHSLNRRHTHTHMHTHARTKNRKPTKNNLQFIIYKTRGARRRAEKRVVVNRPLNELETHK